MGSLSWFLIWVLSASLLCIGELAAKNFIFLPLAIGAAFAAITESLGGDLLVQWMVFISISVVCLAVVRPFIQRITDEDDKTSSKSSLFKRCGIVSETIDPEAGTGKVRVGAEEWNAISSTGKAIDAGTSIEIVESYDDLIKVRPTRSLCGSCTSCKPDAK